MKKFAILFTVVFSVCSLHSQIASIIPSGSSIAGTSVADNQSHTAFANPALISYIPKFEAGVFFENRFILSELSTRGAQFSITTPYVSTSFQFSYFGFNVYHDMLLGIGFARNFAEKFALGVQFNYYSTYFSGVNTYKSAFFPQIGLNVKITPHLNLGFSTFNPFQTSIKETLILKRIPSIFSLGTSYNFSDEFVWKFQIDKEISSNFRIATGFDYEMLNFLKVKIGTYYDDYLVMCLGTGFNFKGFIIDLNEELHPVLGLNTQATIKYRF